MSQARDFADSFSAVSTGRRNMIINGAMQVAQRGTSFTSDNVYTIDRWKSGDGTGGSPARTLSQEEFSLGQTDVPDARYYLKHDQTAASTNGNSSLSHRIEDVTRFDGNTVTLSFYAKADSAMDVDVRFIQDFGTGGSPSSDVTLTETVNIGTSWAKYTVTKTLGSLSGKTIGTDGEHTSFLNIDMEFQPTTTFTFEATLFQLELGNSASPFEHRSYGEELALCQRYYQKWYHVTGRSSDSQTPIGAGKFNVPMRASPTISRSGNALTGDETGTTVVVTDAERYYVYNNSGFAAGGNGTASAEL